MSKNPKAHNVMGYRSDYDGTVYSAWDRRLDGYGNPPSDPHAQAELPGSGRLVMAKRIVDVESIPAELRPHEDMWLLKPADDRRGLAINLGEPEPEPEPET